MILLLPAILLAFTIAVMLALHFFRPQFANHRLLAMAGGFLAWAAVWLVRVGMPQSLVLFNWFPRDVFPVSPALMIDQWSWPFALAILSLALAVMLTDVGRMEHSGFWDWVGTLGLAVLGLFAVSSGNLLTLLMAWTLTDLLEIVLLVPRVMGTPRLNSVIIYFSTSLFGTLLALGAELIARAQGEILAFESMPSQAGLLLLVALGLRLGVFPLHVPLLREPALQRGLGTMLRLIPPAASLVLLPRIAIAGFAFGPQVFLLSFGALAPLYGAAAWLRSSNEIMGRPYWNLALAAFAIASVVLGDTHGAVIWSLAMIFVGGFAFLSSLRPAGFRYFVIPLAFGLSMLPFSPTWPGAALFTAGFNPLLVLYLISYALLLVGLVRHLLRQTGETEGREPWVLWVYNAGLVLLLASYYLVGFLPPFGFPSSIQTIDFLPSAMALSVIAVVVILQRRKIRVPESAIVGLDSVFSLRWFYHLSQRIFYSLRSIAGFISGLFEGEGGILWALIFVALIISAIAGLGPGA